MKTRYYLFFAFVLIISFAACQSQKKSDSTPQNRCERIVSLAPSITETLFELGLVNNIKGVTKYCNYPQKTAEIAKVGGYYDPDFEAIIKQKPTVVMLLKEHLKAADKLKSFGINSLPLDYSSIPAIVESGKNIGKYCAVKTEKFEKLFPSAPANPATNIKVLVVVGRTHSTGVLSEIYIAGKSTFYNNIIELSGGVNGFVKEGIAYPKISMEGLISINPDIIIDIVYGSVPKNIDIESVKKEWNSAAMINAVKNNKVFVINKDYAVIPGPRLSLLIKEITEIIRNNNTLK